MRRWLVASGLAAVGALSGCTCDTGVATDSGGGGGGTDATVLPGTDASSAPGTDAGPPPLVVAVYAHTADTLYQVNPDTFAVTMVGPFQWPTFSDQMTDIALDATGYMVGISYDSVYAVDRETAACTYLSALDRMFNGLSFIPAEAFEPGGAEILVAAALDGSLYEVDPATGASTAIGNYGGGLGSSGDVVSVIGLGTIATVRGLFDFTDQLAWVNPTTGAATLIGNTGVTDIWGLGYWGDRAFGFTDAGQFVLIDVMTGAATVQESSGINWWGAGVTTMAPVIL